MAGFGESNDLPRVEPEILQTIPLVEWRSKLYQAGACRDEICMLSADSARHPGSPCPGDNGAGLFCLAERRRKQY